MYSSKWKGKENHDILIILFERNSNKSKFLREQRDKENIYIFTFIVVI